MKKIMMLLFAGALMISCKKHSDPQPAASAAVAKKKGALLFWTNDPLILSTCGVLTVKLGNGQQANITGYYFVAPANCVNLFGGYFNLEEGSYTYQITSGNSACNLGGGTVNVVGETCNFARIN